MHRKNNYRRVKLIGDELNLAHELLDSLRFVVVPTCRPQRFLLTSLGLLQAGAKINSRDATLPVMPLVVDEAVAKRPNLELDLLDQRGEFLLPLFTRRPHHDEFLDRLATRSEGLVSGVDCGRDFRPCADQDGGQVGKVAVQDCPCYTEPTKRPKVGVKGR